MLLKMIMILLTQTFGFLTGIIFPALPAGVTNNFNVLLDYIEDGYAMLTIFLDTGYITSLFGWWITVGSLVMVVELMMWIWSAVTGNIHTEYVTESTTQDGEFQRTTGGIRYGKPYIRTRHVRKE